MSDIFISYASEDRGRVQPLARALEREGWSVWWDRHIRTGQSFDEAIQEALDASKAVVVVWTKTSVKSQWVKNEAREGLRRSVLFPVMLFEEIKIPLEFGHLQAARLMDWQPEESHSGFNQFVQDLARILGPSPGAAVQPPPVKQPPAQPPSKPKPKPDRESPPESRSPEKPDGSRHESTPPTPSAQSLRYIFIGIGLLLAIGAIVAYGIVSHKDGAPMLLIPAGEFWMGSPDGEGQDREHPHHHVSLDAFYMDKFEVTVARYAEFVRSTNRVKPKYWAQVDSGKHGKLPVVGVDWYDAEDYCRWAGKRLPTEAEWEKAARGTDGRTYPWGNEPPTPRLANFNKEYMANFYDEGLAPVDSHEVGNSPYGLHHMAGNVWEWTADWFDYDSPDYKNSSERSPKGPLSGKHRVVRGGSWVDEPDGVRSAFRNWFTPAYRHDGIGFRCAKDSPR